MLALQDDDDATEDAAIVAQDEEEEEAAASRSQTPQHLPLLLHQTPTRSSMGTQVTAWDQQQFQTLQPHHQYLHHQQQQQPQHQLPNCKTLQLLERRRKVAASAASIADASDLGAASEFAAVLGSSPAVQQFQQQQQQPQQPLRCLWAGWVFMCWASGMMASAAFLLPYWLKGTREAAADSPVHPSRSGRHLSDLGLFRLCAYPAMGPDGRVQLVLDCGHYRHLSEIPSPAWRLAFALMAAASSLTLLLTFFLAFTGFRLTVLRIRPVLAACGLAQLGAAACILLTCLLYPVGWSGNPDVAQVCGGSAGPFRLGRCQLGWAFVLACASGFLATATVAFPVQIGRHYLLPATPLVQHCRHGNTTSNGRRRRPHVQLSSAYQLGCSSNSRQRQPLLQALDSRPASVCTDCLPAAV